MAANVDQALEEEKKAFKAYLLTKNVSEKSANVAVSKAFGIWKLKSRETFEGLMKSDNFEKDAKALLVEIYKGNEKKAAAYYSELKRYYIYYLEKNGLPVPAELKNSKPGRKPGSTLKTKKAAAKKTVKKTTKKAAANKTTKKAAAKKTAAKKTTAKKETAKTTAAKGGRKPAAAKAATKATAAKKATAKKTAGRKAAVKTTAKKAVARNVSSASNAALVKAINELNKTLAPIAKLAQKLK